MKILVFGGTRFMGTHLVKALLKENHDVTIATRGILNDNYGERVKRIIVDRTDASSMEKAFSGSDYEIIFDNIAFASNDVKYLLDYVKCDRYIQISTMSVYEPLHINLKEEEFNPLEKILVWCNRSDFSYNEVKRQAECAITQIYSQVNSVMVRFPFVIGEDDYTKRLYFYVEHIMNELPMHIDNFSKQMSFISSSEAGEYLAFLTRTDFSGAINGANEGTISIKEIAEYVEAKTGKKAILTSDGECGPYNGAEEYSINIEKAKKLGYEFSDLKSWIFDLIDFHVEKVKEGM